jgi:hypothetical protein
VRLIGSALLTLVLSVSCASANRPRLPTECHTIIGSGSLCLVSLGKGVYEPEGSGLNAPLSAEVLNQYGESLSHQTTFAIDSHGRLRPSSAFRVAVPGGAGPVRIRLTGSADVGAMGLMVDSEFNR